MPPTPQVSLDLGADFDPSLLLQSTLKDAPDYLREAIAKLVQQNGSLEDIAKMSETSRGASMAAALARSGLPIGQATQVAEIAQNPAGRVDADAAVFNFSDVPYRRGSSGKRDSKGAGTPTRSTDAQRSNDQDLTRKQISEAASIAAALVHGGAPVVEASRLAESAVHSADVTDANSSVTYVKSPDTGLAEPSRIPTAVVFAPSGQTASDSGP